MGEKYACRGAVGPGRKGYDGAAWGRLTLGFLALSVLASATYLINDIRDLNDDRRHWSKRDRPIAKGMISIARARTLAGVGVIASFALGILLGLGATVILGLYLVLSLTYSFLLKREPILDVLTLACLFTIRLGLGVILGEVRFSPWLFVVSMFVFLSMKPFQPVFTRLRSFFGWCPLSSFFGSAGFGYSAFAGW